MKRDANDILREGGKEELLKAFDNAPAEPFGRPGGTKGNGDAGAPRTRPKFVVQRANSLTFSPDLEWLIKGVLPLQGVALAFGELQAFKSFAVLDVLDRVSRGEVWAARKTRKVPVLYIASEAPQSFAKRKAGIEAANGAPLSDDFIVITVAPNLGTEKNDLEALIAAIEQSGVKPGLIAIDTVAASLGGGEENGTGGQIFLSNARALSNHFKACMIPVHHPGLTSGADKRPRGYSGFTCNVDVQILFERKAGSLVATLTVQKVKDGPADFSLSAHLAPIVIGQDADGDDVSTLVVTRIDEGGAAVATRAPRTVPRQQRLLMESVAQAIDEAGEDFRSFADGPIVRAVKDDAVRSRYYGRIAEDAGPGESADKLAERQRKALNRTIEAAIKAKELMARRSDSRRLLWLPSA